MNKLALGVLFVFVIFILIGYKRGLFKSALRLVLVVVSLFLSYFFAPLFADLMIRYTSVDDYFYNKAYTAIENTVKEKVESNLQDEMGHVTEDTVNAFTDAAMKQEPTRVEQIDLINELNVPDFIKKALLDYNHDDTKQSLGVSSFYDYVATYVSRMIVNALSFAFTCIFFAIIFGIISIISQFVIQLPIVGFINRLGGAALGFFEALFIVWFFFAIMSILANANVGVWFFKQIDDNGLLTLIYNKNIFMNAITSLSNIL